MVKGIHTQNFSCLFQIATKKFPPSPITFLTDGRTDGRTDKLNYRVALLSARKAYVILEKLQKEILKPKYELV